MLFGRRTLAVVTSIFAVAACAPKGKAQPDGGGPDQAESEPEPGPVDTAPQTSAAEAEPDAPVPVEPVDPPNEVEVEAWTPDFDWATAAPEGVEMYGDFEAAITWTDREGRNAVLIGRKQNEHEDKVTTTMRAEHWIEHAVPGSRERQWMMERRFKERVDACAWDTELSAMSGDWSVSDLDKDGYGEATFAWRVGCRSDLSPVGHKVLLIEYNGGATDKYVLRGQTQLAVAGGASDDTLLDGGSFTADSAFDQAPPEFLAHAKAVWARTAVERFE